MIDTLLGLIPVHKRYVEVFGGSGELLFSKPRSQSEVYNDLNGYLVNLFLQVRDKLRELQERLMWLPDSRQIHHKWSWDFKHGVAPSDPLEQAARYYYVLCCQFAGRMYSGWAVGRSSWSNARVEKLREIHTRLQGVMVENRDFKRVLELWDSPETFFFLDPPYIGTEGYGMRFNAKRHVELAQALNEVEGSWLLTVNDHPLARRLYRKYLVLEEDTLLSSQKKNKGEKRGKMKQLIIKR